MPSLCPDSRILEIAFSTNLLISFCFDRNTPSSISKKCAKSKSLNMLLKACLYSNKFELSFTSFVSDAARKNELIYPESIYSRLNSYYEKVVPLETT